MLQLSMTFEYQLAGPMGIHGTFWLFGVISLVGFFFVLCFLRESRGLTDKEKKELYMPRKINKVVTRQNNKSPD